MENGESLRIHDILVHFMNNLSFATFSTTNFHDKDGEYVCKQANLFVSQGGPIILAQIENEYGNVMTLAYGDAGKEYINWCAHMAESLNIGVPWIMCQQSDAPTTYH
ncbi:hypothetical protein IC575_022127 [Cucumis melo]